MSESAFARLEQDMEAFKKTSVLAALAELDVATRLLQGGNAMTASELAKACACDERGMEALLDALGGLKYLAKENGKYSVPEDLQDALDSRSPTTCIPIMRHYACLQRSWSHLAWSVREGTPRPHEPSILGAEEDRVSFIMGMNSVATRLVKGVVDSLLACGVFPLPAGSVILDIGGASGTYTEAFLKALPDTRAVLFDLPDAVVQAHKRFDPSPLAGRVQLVAGDFTRDDLPAGCDFAWISAIIHQMSRAESRSLYKKALAALNPGGLVAIRDFVVDETRTSPVAGTFFGVNMLVNTETGRVYSLSEISEDLAAAGFAEARLAVDVPSMCAIVTARKPA